MIIMAPIQSGSLVLVTGGNGFIAAHCIAALLRDGYQVRATVRSAEKGDATRKSLNSASVERLERLSFVVVPDPTDLSSLSSALEDCEAVLHLASAFNYDAVPAEFEEKLMIPALKGTQVICEAAGSQPTVRRVVIMSSFASVYDASLGLQPGRVYTEQDWCPLTYEDGVYASAVVRFLFTSIYSSFLANKSSPSHIEPRKLSPSGQHGIMSETTKSVIN